MSEMEREVEILSSRGLIKFLANEHMRKRIMLKKFAIAAAISAISAAAMADTAELGATVGVIKPVDITVTQNLDLGTVTKPLTGFGRYRVKYDGTVIPLSGDGIQVVDSAGQPGKFSVSADESYPVLLSWSIGDHFETGQSWVQRVWVKTPGGPNLTSGDAITVAGGSQDFLVSARIAVKSTAATGSYTSANAVQITAEYQ